MRGTVTLVALALLAGCGVGGTEAPAKLPIPGLAAANGPTWTQDGDVAGSGTCVSTSVSPAPDNLQAMAAAVLCLVNTERRGAGLPALRPNGALKKASQRMANLMVSERFFSHTTPDGRSLLDRVRPTGYIDGESWALGENLAWGTGPLATPRAIVNGWMDSPGHRANILYGKFRDIGIGITLGAPRPDLSGGTTYVIDFGRHG